MRQARSVVFDRQLRFELLESRVLLAGNVVASVVDGKLVILGDRDDNAIKITQIDPGIYTVSGLDGTTVNDVASFTNTEALTGSVKISMKAGADAVVIHPDDPVTLPKNLKVRMGRGDDGVCLEQLTVTGNTKIKTGAADDDVDIEGSTFQGLFKLNTRSGDDRVAVSESQFDGEVELKTRSGKDVVVVGDATFADAVEARLGDNRDTMYVGDSVFEKAVEVHGGHRPDTLKVLADNTFNTDPVLKSIQRENHPDQQIQDVLADLDIDAFCDELLAQ